MFVLEARGRKKSMELSLSGKYVTFLYFSSSSRTISFFFFNGYLFLRQRETEHEQGRGRERGRHRIRNRLQAPSRQPRARRGARTHGPRDRDLSRSRPLHRLSHPGAPRLCFSNAMAWYTLSSKGFRACRFSSFAWPGSQKAPVTG